MIRLQSGLTTAVVFLSACLETSQIPPLPEGLTPAEATLGVTGWEHGRRASLWIPDSESVSWIRDEASIHLLHTGVRIADLPGSLPRTLVTEPLDLKTEGIPIPIVQAYRLELEGGLRWEPEELGDELKYRWPSQDNLQVCAALGGCYRAGVCDAVDCQPPEIEPPALPRTPQPDGWTNLGTDAEPFYFPQKWADGGEVAVPELNLACPAGQADFGEGCRPLAACPGERFAPPPAGRLVYVDATAAINGDGSEQAPFARLESALPPASPGVSVMLAEGSYPTPSAALLVGVEALVGVCASKVELQGGLEVNSGRLRVSGLRVEGDTGIQITDGELHLEGVAVLGRELALLQSGGSIQTSSSALARVPVTTEHQLGLDIRGGAFMASTTSIVERAFVRNARFVLERSVMAEGRTMIAADNPPTMLLFFNAHVDLIDSQFIGFHGRVVRFSDERLPDADSSLDMQDVLVAGPLAEAVWIQHTTAQVNLSRLAVTYLPGDDSGQVERQGGVAFKVTTASVTASDLALTGFGLGMLLEELDLQPYSVKSKLSVQRAWIGWTGLTALWTLRARVSFFGEDIWMLSEEAALPADEKHAGIAHRRGLLSLKRAYIRPNLRHGLRLEAHEAFIEDVTIAGPHARSLLASRGLIGSIRRVQTARLIDESGVLEPGGLGIELGEDDTSIMGDLSAESIDIEIDQKALRDSPFAASLVVRPSRQRWSNFRLRGVSGVEVPSDANFFRQGEIFVTDVPEAWPPPFVGALDGVRVSVNHTD